MSITNLINDWSRYRKGAEEGGFHEYEHQWAMVVDLNKCIGCNACSVACYAENNLPVVGETRFAKNQGMHWMRVERFWDEPDLQPYVATASNSLDAWIEGNPPAPRSALKPSNPAPIAEGMLERDGKGFNEQFGFHGTKSEYQDFGGSFLPMMCQQCHSATCEPVCPVAATYHTPDGLNAQVYNRCIGSRYCSNNCPYRLRFFNFWSYYEDAWPEPLHMQLNPDLTVRDKGVMEKCTFCVHRIRVVKDEARMENRKVKDGEFATACVQSCPTSALVFGDKMDPDSQVAKLWNAHQVKQGPYKQTKENKELRGYRILEGLNTDPSVMYLERVREV